MVVSPRRTSRSPEPGFSTGKHGRGAAKVPPLLAGRMAGCPMRCGSRRLATPRTAFRRPAHRRRMCRGPAIPHHRDVRDRGRRADRRGSRRLLPRAVQPCHAERHWLVDPDIPPRPPACVSLLRVSGVRWPSAVANCLSVRRHPPSDHRAARRCDSARPPHERDQTMGYSTPKTPFDLKEFLSHKGKPQSARKPVWNRRPAVAPTQADTLLTQTTGAGK